MAIPLRRRWRPYARQRAHVLRRRSPVARSNQMSASARRRLRSDLGAHHAAVGAQRIARLGAGVQPASSADAAAQQYSPVAATGPPRTAGRGRHRRRVRVPRNPRGRDPAALHEMDLRARQAGVAIARFALRSAVPAALQRRAKSWRCCAAEGAARSTRGQCRRSGSRRASPRRAPPARVAVACGRRRAVVGPSASGSTWRVGTAPAASKRVAARQAFDDRSRSMGRYQAGGRCATRRGSASLNATSPLQVRMPRCPLCKPAAPAPAAPPGRHARSGMDRAPGQRISWSANPASAC